MRLGDPKQAALKRFLNLENKLDSDQTLRDSYVAFMAEYERLRHMRESDFKLVETENDYYYLPHHAVIKNESLTTKLRVVFDGSARTTNGKSLNDVLLKGPV